MEELKFKVSAELKNILGRDLITSDNIAILELVKNSYDAHATKVDITFDTDKIIIADNGKGMTLDELKNKWLFVGFSAKRDGTEDDSYRSKFKRNYAGAKGIGRISCDRLARYLTLITKSSESDTEETLFVDWKSFEGKQKVEFDTVGIKHKSSTEIHKFPNDSTTGTILEFSVLHTNWGWDEIIELRKSLEKMINPFSETDEYKIEIFAPNFVESDNRITEQINNIHKNNPILTDKERATIAELENSKVTGVIVNTINDVLKIKTTQIESILKDGIIHTKLSDRGEVMYEIEEINKFGKLENVSINLYYLNRAAKYNFSLKMGVQPVNYGNVFLFRNGFRIWPYGEYNDDSWGLNQRAQQGYNRFLGTRDLFGRVDVETNRVEDFKEVSSRDGGLIKTKASQELLDFFSLIHRRLERYVVGVLWGEGFIRNSYFQDEKFAYEAREQLKHGKDLDNTDYVYDNIGSKVDFLQLVKSMVNDGSIHVKYYNTKLADLVSDASASEIIQLNVLNDLRKIAEKMNDSDLSSKIELFEKEMAKMRKEKEEAEKKAEEERLKAIMAKRKEEAEKAAREKAEKERDAQIQKNTYLISARDTSQEVEDLMHTVLISSAELNSLVSSQKEILQEEVIDREELIDITRDMEFNIERIHVLSSLITKADTSLLRESTDVDLYEYTKEFLSFFSRSLKVDCVKHDLESYVKKVKVLEYSVIFQNLISNSRKNNATQVFVSFQRKERSVVIDFSDDGDGVDLNRFTPETIFEVGVTNRPGGHGIGLSTIRNTLERDMNGTICFLGNNINKLKGATFRIILQ